MRGLFKARWMLTVIAATFLVMVLVNCAWAQKGCDKFNAGTGSGTNPAVERVFGKPGESVYLCGYVIMHVQGSAVEFELSSGLGNNCATDTVVILPRMAVAPGFSLVNRIPYAYGEFTKPGYSLCTQTFGNGAIYTIFYWAQY